MMKNTGSEAHRRVFVLSENTKLMPVPSAPTNREISRSARLSRRTTSRGTHVETASAHTHADARRDRPARRSPATYSQENTHHLHVFGADAGRETASPTTLPPVPSTSAAGRRGAMVECDIMLRLSSALVATKAAIWCGRSSGAADHQGNLLTARSTRLIRIVPLASPSRRWSLIGRTELERASGCQEGGAGSVSAGVPIRRVRKSPKSISRSHFHLAYRTADVR